VTVQCPTTPPPTPPIERELQRFAITLRQIADAVEHIPLRQVGDFVQPIAPAERCCALPGS